MTPPDPAKSVNAGYALAITAPEEGALAAYRAVEDALLAPLHITRDNLPMDLATRILTNGDAVAAASAFVQASPTVTYVKGPGITPRDDQVITAIIDLEKSGRLIFTGKAETLNAQVAKLRSEHTPEQSVEHANRFAKAVKSLLHSIGSPNAAWRSDLAANLARGTSDKLAARSLVKPPTWNDNTPLQIFALPADDENRATVIADKDTNLVLSFTPDTASEPTMDIGRQKVSAGTPVRLFAFNKDRVQHWTKDTLAQIDPTTLLAHGTKQTVLKTCDTALIRWMQEIIEGRPILPIAQNKNDPKKLGGLLVDDLFARLSTSELTAPTAILSPNASYSRYVKDVWDKIKAKGGFKPPVHSEIVRASATGDHYKAMEFTAPEAGKLTLKDESGKIVLEKHVEASDVVMVTHFDRKRVQGLVTQALNGARAGGRTNILFGFDASDPYYQIAVEELDKVRSQFSDLKIEVMEAAEATAHYLTSGVKDTALLLGNIQGDFATDIEIAGKGTSYSIGTIYDGRGVVELGAGGTAPDLLELWKKTGTLRFNPMSFVEGISLALKFAAQKMSAGTQQNKTLALASAIEDGMYASTDKGVVLPIVKGKFTSNAASPTIVSTQTFVKSVQVETLRLLPDTSQGELATAERELVRMIAIDKALFEADATYNKEWQAANMLWNEAREKAGTIDPFNPDYSLTLPDEVKTESLTAEKLLHLQQARAALAGDMSNTIKQKNLKECFIALGVQPTVADVVLERDTRQLKEAKAIAA